MEFTVTDIARMVKGEVRGDASGRITHFAPIEQAGAGAISFVASAKYIPHLEKCRAAAVLIGKKLAESAPREANLIIVEDVYSTVAQLLERFGPQQESRKGREEPCFIHPTATVPDSCYIGAFAYIGAGVVLGEGVQVYPQAYIGDNSQIKDHTVIYSGAKLYARTQVGRQCILHAGCVVGSDGFGFAPQTDGSFMKIPQLGNVVIHDFVEIGANTTIDRATMNATIIGEGVKLDNLIQIAHNVEIGDYTAIASQAGISGSTKIGKRCLIGGQVGVVGHIHLADGTQVGAQSGVAHAVKENNQKLFGSPAIPAREAMRAQVVFKQLPELNERLQKVERYIEQQDKRS